MTKTGKIILIAIIASVLLYNGAKWAWGEAAEAYFDYRCNSDAGEFIYRTVDNVEGVFQMRPREQGEYFSRLRKGNLMEDPYGHTNKEANRPWDMFLPEPKDSGYQYFESKQGPNIDKYKLYKEIMTIASLPKYTGEPYWRYTYHGLRREYKSDGFWTMHEAKQVSELKSEYGYTWNEVQNELDKLFGVIGSEITVLKIDANETLAVKKGFFFWPPWSVRGGICPKGKHETFIYEFIAKVLQPIDTSRIVLEEKEYGY